jgi:hypothetical protein
MKDARSSPLDDPGLSLEAAKCGMKKPAGWLPAEVEGLASQKSPGTQTVSLAERGGFEPRLLRKYLSLQIILIKHHASRHLEPFHKISCGRRSLPGAVQ